MALILGRNPSGQALAEQAGIANRLELNLKSMGLADLRDGESRYVPDTAVTQSLTAPYLVRAGVRSTLAIRVRCPHDRVGLLLASKRAVDGFSAHDQRFLGTIARQICLTVGHDALLQELQRSNEDLRASLHGAVQLARLRAFGEMAAGVVHDINNAVSPILGLTDMVLKSDAALPDDARQALEIARMAAGDIVQVARRMRDFYRERKQPDDEGPVQLAKLVDQALQLARARLRDIPEANGIAISAMNGACGADRVNFTV